MKAGRFTEAQNKEDRAGLIDSVGAIVAYCESKDGGGQIPRFDISAPRDIVDTTIKDLKEYTKTLIYEDKALASEIELYLKNRSIQEQMQREKDDGIFNKELEDKDFIDFSKFLEEGADQDNDYYNYEDEDD